MQQSARRPNVTSHTSSDEPGFSLVLGGPLYQLYLRTRLAQPALALLRRRVIAMSAICWLPLLLLSLIDGHAWEGVAVPFLSDVGVHARFLVAVPILVGSELMVHQRIGIIVHQFIERGMITPKEQGFFDHLVASTARIRNSVVVEVVLLLVVVIAGPLLWRHSLTYGVSTWYAVVSEHEMHTTPAGDWYEFVSSSILRFLTLRWYFRLFLWYRFVWCVRGLPLHLNLFHPDRVAGLGFLAGSVRTLAPVLVAQTVVVAGVIGDRIWHGGQKLTDFKLEVVCSVVFLMLVALVPLSFFMAKLEQAERVAKLEYGRLGSYYVEDFRRKWIEDHGTEGEALLGTQDIQSQADLGLAYKSLEEMRLLLFTKQTVIRLVVFISLPLALLALTMVPLETIIVRLLKFAF
jgi:hypothetical protein